jgi:acetyl-CoA C-acetyltransferase
MSKYATGVYSTAPADWSANDRYAVLPKASDKVPLAAMPADSATVESYTISHTRTGSVAVWIGRNAAGERVIGNADLTHEPTRAAFEGGEPFGARLAVTRNEQGLNIGRLA